VARFFSIAQGIWANHPARAALNLAVPVVERSIRRRPVASVAIAAGFGASVVLIPEWRRLLFATGRKAMLGPISTAALASVALNLFSAYCTEPRDI
jgi:xanthine/uracil permease